MLTIASKNLDGVIKEYSVIYSDLDSDTAGRNAKGEMLRDRIRILRKINVTTIPTTTAQIKEVLTALSEPFFSVKFLDPQTGTEQTKTFYVGDRTAPVMRQLTVDGKKQWLWDSMTFNLIER